MPDVEIIAEGTFGGATAVTFSEISQDYQHLCLDLRTSSVDTAADYREFGIQINGETSDYGYGSMYFANNSFTGTASHGTGTANMGMFPSQSDDAERRAAIKCWFGNYSQTDMNPSWLCSIMSVQYNDDQGATYSSSVGSRASTAAITSITVLSNSGNFDSDSRYCMYGWKVA